MTENTATMSWEERLGKEPKVGEEDNRPVVINGPRWFNDIAG